MKRILIIDDYKEIRDLYSDTLKKVGYDVVTMESGELGVIEILKGGYDLILLDLLMPRKDGIWVLDQINQVQPSKPNGKIILMGISNDAKDHKDLIDQAMCKGVSGFLDKRISVTNELVLIINKYLL